MLRKNRKKFMNLSEEKTLLYERLHDFMYRESIRTGKTPKPKELEDPQEWRAFCHWKHMNWLRLARAAADKYIASLKQQEAFTLAENPPPYPSKT